MSTIYEHVRTKNLPGLGRELLLQSIVEKLIRGDHVSVVGPRYTGKSCLMRALAARAELRERFVCVALCDLRHEIVDSNESFFSLILRRIRQDATCSQDWREFAEPAIGVTAWHTLADLVKGMADEGVKALIVLDGLDETAVNAAVDVNAWNNLNDLIDLNGALFVATSRVRIADSDLDTKSRGSIFFTRFVQPIQIPAVGLEELDSWLGERKETFDKGAKSEVIGQTGGHPQLLSALLHEVCQSEDTIDVNTVQEAAQRLVNDRAEALISVINEMRPEWLESLSVLDTQNSPDAMTLTALRTRFTIKRDRAEPSCRMLATVAKNKTPGEASLKALFGGEGDYFANIAKALRLRLSQLGNGSTAIERHARNLVDHLDQPDFAIMVTRNLQDATLEAIHQTELAGRPFPRFEMERFPTEWREGNRAQNLWVIECLTSDRSGVKARKVTRSVWVLLSMLHNAGNFSNHRLKDEATRAFALSVATTSVELIAEMKRCGLLE